MSLRSLSHLYPNAKAASEAFGEAIGSGRVPRRELCLCMKLMANEDGSNLQQLTEGLLRAFGLEAFDVALLYLPANSAEQAVRVWAKMEQLARLGLARSLGLSNHYDPAMIAPLLRAERPPVINQVRRTHSSGARLQAWLHARQPPLLHYSLQRAARFPAARCSAVHPLLRSSCTRCS